MRAIAFALLLLPPAAAWGQCRGDFNRDGATTVDEVVAVLNEALAGCAECRGDFNGDHAVTVDEVLVALGEAMNGCPGPTPTPPACSIRFNVNSRATTCIFRGSAPNCGLPDDVLDTYLYVAESIVGNLVVVVELDGVRYSPFFDAAPASRLTANIKLLEDDFESWVVSGEISLRGYGRQLDIDLHRPPRGVECWPDNYSGTFVEEFEFEP